VVPGAGFRRELIFDPDCLMFKSRTGKGGWAIRDRRGRGGTFLLVSLVVHALFVLSLGLSGLRFHRPGEAGAGDLTVARPAFEVVEVPDRVPEETPVRPTNLLSDRAARAADMNPAASNIETDPYSPGDVDVRQYEEGKTVTSAAKPSGEDRPADRANPQPENREGDLTMDVPWDEIASYTGQDAGSSGDAGGTPSFRNLVSGAGREGALSFNTYDWDFAPYMLAMKRAIQSHLFPPYAFTHMGLVSGTNVVHFVVMPNGRIRDLSIVDSNTHFSLDRTSVRAIETSVPFLPLPKDFPEPYLDVTARFSYVVHREK
jgi:TonB family protein